MSDDEANEVFFYEQAQEETPPAGRTPNLQRLRDHTQSLKLLQDLDLLQTRRKNLQMGWTQNQNLDIVLWQNRRPDHRLPQNLLRSLVGLSIAAISCQGL